VSALQRPRFWHCAGKARIFEASAVESPLAADLRHKYRVDVLVEAIDLASPGAAAA
jgi:hypothetical protein